MLGSSQITSDSHDGEALSFSGADSQSVHLPSADKSRNKPLTPSDEQSRKRRELRRKRGRQLKRVLMGLLVLAAAAAVALALRPKPVAVDVANVTRGPLSVAVEETGVTRVKDRYVVSAPVTGRLSRISLEAGDQINEAAALAQIAPLEPPLLDPRTRAQAEAQLGAALSSLGRTRSDTSRAQAALEQAQQELARTQKLVGSGSLTEQALSHSQFELRMRDQEHASSLFAEKVASEQVRLARAALGQDDTSASGDGAQRKSVKGRDSHVDVRAPTAGQVLRVHQQSEGVVQAGANLLEVGDPTSLEVVVDLLTTDAVHVSPGTRVEISGWGGDHALNGSVRKIEPSAFTRPSALGIDEQRVNVIVSLSDPREQWAALGDGYRVEGRIELWHAEDVLQVPHGAVFRYGNDWSVFVLDGDHVRRVPVSIGHRGDDAVEITAGLEAGARVAVHPGDRVKDGVQVAPRQL